VELKSATPLGQQSRTHAEHQAERDHKQIPAHNTSLDSFRRRKLQIFVLPGMNLDPGAPARMLGISGNYKQYSKTRRGLPVTPQSMRLDAR